ncbi:MAG: HPP family protein [Bacteroidetes bacterium]|nr:HPP family protein [Bacteroidota bacterium]
MPKETLQKTYRRTKYIVYKETTWNFQEKLFAFIGAFLSIGIVAFLQSTILDHQENFFLIGSFGASCVLVFGAAKSPLAQTRSLVGGHLISALVGVTIYKLIPDPLWLNAPLAVACSIVLMQFTKTLHPPGGATALIAVIGTEKIKSLGYLFVLSPILSGCLILTSVAFLCNYVPNIKRYPLLLKRPKFQNMRITKF